MDIILKILSIIGIALVVLLGILIVTLIIILFVPIYYKGIGKYDASGAFFEFKAHWLLGILRAKFGYSEGIYFHVKILKKIIFTSAKNGTSLERKTLKSKDEDNTKKTEITEDIQKAESLGEIEDYENIEKLDDFEDSKNTEKIDDFEDYENIESTESRNIFEKIILKIQSIIDIIQVGLKKWKNIKENIDYYVELLQDKDTKDLFSHVLKLISNIWKKIRPKKLYANIQFGMNSPDVTGYIYGIYCMAIPVLGKNIFVTPDFENSCFEGNLKFKGKIRIIVLLINGLKLILDKRLWAFIQKLKKEDFKDGR